MVVSEQNQQASTSTDDRFFNLPLFDILIEFFNEDGWVYKEIEHRRVVALGIEGKNGRFDCYTIAREEEKQITVYSIFPVKVPDYKRQNISNFVTRANYGMVIGNFEMNFYDGEIRYKTSLDVAGDRLTPALIKHLIYTNVSTMDKFLPGIMSIIYGNISPEEAISRY
ncbi:MAG: YbjN domain-containing protein [Arthrospira sp. SH-MAG29]|nr:YbjN domain-containing protein [Arthrospira sp. SH-MAG29]MBS0016100.1 YbjN domain-containing protein [Arthrospira sp. SH-MAG29]